MAHIFDASVQVHVCGSPISLAAALQVEAAIPNFQIHENHVINKVNFIRELGTVDIAAVNGGLITITPLKLKRCGEIFALKGRTACL